MEFYEVTSRMLEAGFTLPEMGKALGVAPTTMRAYRLRPGTGSYRTPPAEWRGQLAALARERGEALLELARQLEGE